MLPCQTHKVKITAAHRKRVVSAQAREAAKDTDPRRSNRWPAVRKRFLKANKDCAACGATVGLQVHHVVPFHLAPLLELAPENLVALCMSVGGLECHERIGHGSSFRAYNPTVLDDCAELRANPGRLREILARVRANRRI